jgi:hypothetical protein
MSHPFWINEAKILRSEKIEELSGVRQQLGWQHDICVALFRFGLPHTIYHRIREVGD